MPSIKKYGVDWVAYYDDLERYHRVDGPAIEFKGNRFWLVDGKRHRLDGPAVEWESGSIEYWIKGERYDFEEWDRARKLLLFI